LYKGHKKQCIYQLAEKGVFQQKTGAKQSRSYGTAEIIPERVLLA
jgi:predicted transcriptional regulator YheO